MGSTEDSGPMKPGNRAEEKTLTTGKTRATEDRHPAVGSHGREARVDTIRKSIQWVDSGPRKPMGAASSARAPNRISGEVSSSPGPAPTPTIPGHSWRQRVTEKVK